MRVGGRRARVLSQQRNPLSTGQRVACTLARAAPLRNGGPRGAGGSAARAADQQELARRHHPRQRARLALSGLRRARADDRDQRQQRAWGVRRLEDRRLHRADVVRVWSGRAPPRSHLCLDSAGRPCHRQRDRRGHHARARGGVRLQAEEPARRDVGGARDRGGCVGRDGGGLPGHRNMCVPRPTPLPTETPTPGMQAAQPAGYRDCLRQADLATCRTLSPRRRPTSASRTVA